MIYKVCSECGSDGIAIRRMLYWSFEQQEWVGEPFLDEVECAECGHSNPEILDVVAAPRRPE